MNALFIYVRRPSEPHCDALQPLRSRKKKWARGDEDVAGLVSELMGDDEVGEA
jgi:hypothetical protein